MLCHAVQILNMAAAGETDLKLLLTSFFPLAWIGHISLGLNYGLMGTARPYLAKYVL